jgi:general secretion pathway protein J
MQRGFTLIEMLAALSVASLLVSLVYGAVRIGQRSVSAMDAQIEQSDIMRIGWEFLHNALSRALPMPNPEDEEDNTSFGGTTKVLTFVADMPAYVGAGGLMRITLGIDEASSKSQLVLTRQRYEAYEELSTEQPVQRAVLIEDLDHLEIGYFARLEDDDIASWHDEWLGFDALPNLVRIDVAPAGAKAWPRLVAQPSSGGAPLGESDTQFVIGAPEE